MPLDLKNKTLYELIQGADAGFDAQETVFDKFWYYLNVGALGHGDEVLQVVFDPVSKLYIPLGETFTEAFETMEKLQELYGNEKDTVYETEGNLAPLLPTDEMETVKITTRKYLFSRKLEFSLEREDHIRATYLSKSDFNNLMFSLKVHRKLHPNL